ncbi:MAG: phenylalanine--tRNA ligase beta subunit-related protein [Desulfurococcaceae archaeon TW002]
MSRALCNKLNELVEIDHEAVELGIFVAYTIAWSEGYVATTDPFSDVLSNLMRAVSLKYDINTLKDNEVIRAYRNFYWRIEIDPTKTRPSSEALIRRLLKGSFPRLNLVVDAGNIASAETLVPIGIYDIRYSISPFTLTLSKGGEIFRPIGGEPEVLRRGIPILVDSKGVVMHLYPHRDCIDTMVREDTREVLIVGAGVSGVPVKLVVEAVERVTELLGRVGWCWCGRSIVKPTQNKKVH